MSSQKLSLNIIQPNSPNGGNQIVNYQNQQVLTQPQIPQQNLQHSQNRQVVKQSNQQNSQNASNTSDANLIPLRVTGANRRAPPQLKLYQTVELNGIITDVSFAKGSPMEFKINCPNVGLTFECVCELFCPLRKGDTIYVLCMVGLDGKLYVRKPPFVQPAIDKGSIIQCFIRCLKIGFQPAAKLFYAISKVAQGEDAVIPILTGLAQHWNDTRDDSILFMFDGYEYDVIKKLLSWWHKERNLRRLYLFGLTKKEINGCRLTCEEIYQKCISNPYTVPAIPMEKCDQILDRLNKTPDPTDQTRGQIIRMIWKNLHVNGWTAMPTRYLSRNFPGIKDHVEALKSDYGMVAELQSAYLKFPHKVETWIADYISKKVKEDFIKYDTPVDVQITLPNGTMIERMSAMFTRDNLSEDQMKAVQGALDHTVSIITGIGGCGKCNAFGTPILMFDGSIRKVETLVPGDLLMGPDSRPRTILSTCMGVDNMFRIVPSKGRPFVCNEPHVLTMKGVTPYIARRTDRPKSYIAKWNPRGIPTSKAFLTQQEAQDFIDALPENIFDMPLNEYMDLAEQRQDFCYLFHTGVNFPTKPVPIDPYLIGHWLGDGASEGAKITTKDPEIVTEYNRILDQYQLILKQFTDIEYRIIGKGDNYRKKGGNQFTGALRDLNLINNKHIPDIYIFNISE